MSYFVDWTWGGSPDSLVIGPGMFSWFHFLWLGIMVAFCVALGILGKKKDPKIDRIVISVLAVVLLFGEIFKQLFWFEYYDYYRFEIFPFQFCSVPIYVSLFATVAPWAKAREVCYRFLAFFGIIGGLAVMLVPSAVLESYFVAISLHSMIWHSILVGMGVYLIVSRGYGKKIKELLTPFYMFAGFVCMAIIGNILVYQLYLGTPNCHEGDNLSMFYISPYYSTQLPLLGAVQEFSYPLFVLCYVALFTGFSLIVWAVVKLVRKCIAKKVPAAQ